MPKALLINLPIFDIKTLFTIASPDQFCITSDINVEPILAKAEAGDPYYQFYMSAIYSSPDYSGMDMDKSNYWLKASADQNYLAAMEFMGIRYLFGRKGFKRDEKKGIKILKECVDNGGIVSLNNLGVYYSTKKDINDKKLGLEYFERAGELNNLSANLALATLYFTGSKIVKKDYDKGLEYLRKTDYYFSSEASYTYAILYSTGKYCFEQDLKKSYFYAYQAHCGHRVMLVPLMMAAFFIDGVVIERNLEAAQKYLNDAQLFGPEEEIKKVFEEIIDVQDTKIESTLNDIKKKMSEYTPEDEDNMISLTREALYSESNFRSQRAIHSFEILANRGNTRAQLELANFYHHTYDQYDNPKDKDSAIFWYKKAMAADIPEAIYNYGYLQSDEYSCPNKVSINNYKFACDKDYAKAYFMLGTLYYDGRGCVECNYDLAFKHLSLSIKLEAKDQMRNDWLPTAYYYLGKCYLYGNGVEKDEKKAFEMFSTGASYGYSECYDFLIMMYDQGIYVKQDKLKAYNIMQALFQYGSYRYSRRLANYYIEGKIVKRDFNQACAILASGIKEGYVGAHYEMAKIAISGWLGKSQNINMKVYDHLFGPTSIAEKNSDFLLALCYDFGFPNKQDHAAAIKAYRRAIFLGNVKAKVNLSVKYMLGEGGKNIQEGFKLCSEAANAGNPIAAANLGLLYKYGRGTDKNDALAKQWLKTSADQGDKVAREALENFDALPPKPNLRKIVVQDYLNFEQLANNTYKLPEDDEEITQDPLAEYFEVSRVFTDKAKEMQMQNYMKMAGIQLKDEIMLCCYNLAPVYPSHLKTPAEIEHYADVCAKLSPANVASASSSTIPVPHECIKSKSTPRPGKTFKPSKRRKKKGKK